MSKKKRSTISNFICPECGLEFPIPRKIGQQREKGHIKDLYCPICNKIQKFTEYTYKQSYKTLEGEIIEEKPLTIQYISCYSLSISCPICFFRTVVSIHLMLLFIRTPA